jgi:hypothetical protein
LLEFHVHFSGSYSRCQTSTQIAGEIVPLHMEMQGAGLEVLNNRISVDLPLKKLPPLQGEGWGGDGVCSGAKTTHPPPDLPLEGGGT